MKKKDKLTINLLIEKGFKFDEKTSNYWIDLVTHYIEILVMPDGFYPVLCEYQEFSSQDEKRISLAKIEYVYQLENIYSVIGKKLC